jgi:protoheme IX farnesyltransferase
MHYRADYAAADIPMLPVVAPPQVVTIRIIAYSWAMVVASLLIWPIAGTSPIYAVASVVLGAGFIREAYALQSRVRAGVGDNPMRLFHMSITYLTLLFIALGVDTILPRSWH